MTPISLDAFFNATLTTLIQQGHGDDYMNEGHFTHVLYMLNLIYYFKHYRSALSHNALNQFTTGSYGPYCDEISDSSTVYDEHQSYKLKYQLREDFLEQATDKKFSICHVPFDIGTIDLNLRQILDQYAVQLWTMSPLKLSMQYINQLKAAPFKYKLYTAPYDLSAAIEYFQQPRHQFWISHSDKENEYRQKLTKHIAYQVLNDPKIDLDQFIKILQDHR